MESVNAREDDGWDKEIVRAERELNRVQSEEDRAIRLYVQGKITEAQLNHQRKFITERLETLRAELDDYRRQQTALDEKRIILENIVDWADKVGNRMDDVPFEQRRDISQAPARPGGYRRQQQRPFHPGHPNRGFCVKNVL